MATNDTTISIDKYDKEATQLLIMWTDGFAPYQLQRCSPLGSSWSNLGNPTMQTTRTVPNNGTEEYFRVQQSVMLLDATLNETYTRLTWSVPDLA